MNKSAVRESVTENADGSSQVYKVDMYPMRTGSVSTWVSGKAITSFTGSPPMGTIDFSGSTLSGSLAPTSAAQIVASYQYNALSDDEISACINLASGGGVLIAAALAARALAGNYGKYFAYTQGGKEIDKDKMSEKFRKLAESLEAAHDKAAIGVGTTLTVATFDDSGTHFEGFDTAVAIELTATA
jgi:hypothetical protein